MDGMRRDSGSPFAVPPDTFWALLPPAEQNALRAAGTVRPYRPGDVVCRQGDEQRYVVVLFAGRVEIEAHGRVGQPLLIATRGPGEIIGELAAVDGSPRSATVRALDDLIALVVPEQRFVLRCRQAPALAWAVLQVVVHRIRELGDQRTDLVGSRVARRVVSALRYLVDQQADGVEPDGAPIELACTQNDLAAMVGSSRESVVRALAVLRTKGVVATARGRIVVLRQDRLRELEE